MKAKLERMLAAGAACACLGIGLSACGSSLPSAAPPATTGSGTSGPAAGPNNAGDIAWIGGGDGLRSVNLQSGALGPVLANAGTGCLAITPDGQTAWVASTGAGRLSSMTLSNGDPGPTITLPNPASSLVLTSTGSLAFVAIPQSSELGVIDLSTHTIESEIKLQAAGLIALSPNGQNAYVTGGSIGSGYVPTENVLSVVDLADDSVAATIPIPAGSTAVAITPNGQTAYVSNDNNTATTSTLMAASVTPVDLVTDTAENPIALRATAQVVGVTPNDATVVVSSQDDGASLVFISTKTNSISTILPLPNHEEATAFTFVHGSSNIWVTTVAGLLEVNEQSHSLEHTYAVSGGANGIVVPGDDAFTQVINGPA